MKSSFLILCLSLSISSHIHSMEGSSVFHGDTLNKARNEARQNGSESEALPDAHKNVGLMSWKRYNRLNVIYNWMDSLQLKYPFVKVLTLGHSSEGREIKMLRISKGGCAAGKPRIFIDGGIHAREWISPAIATFLIKELLGVSGNDKRILTDIIWYFVPVLNPDGYEYSHTTERLWRKSRSRFNGDKCIGTDLNRNFDFHWAEEGIDNDPCSTIYPGPFSASDPETQALQNFLFRNRKYIKLYFTMHSFSQHFNPPWGYTTELPDDYDELKELAGRAVKALTSVRGTEYEVGTSAAINVVSSGGSRDWAKGVAKIKYSYLIELPPTDPKIGFELPPEEIIPTGKETWEAVKVLARHILQKYPKTRKSKTEL